MSARGSGSGGGLLVFALVIVVVLILNAMAGNPAGAVLDALTEAGR